MKKQIIAVAALVVTLGASFATGSALAHGEQGRTCKDGVCYTSYSAQPGDIGIERAQDIAFKHAGVSAGEVRMKKSKLDYEHGVRVYEIEFYVGNMEYEYDINATTGEIMKFKKEVD